MRRAVGQGRQFARATASAAQDAGDLNGSGIKRGVIVLSQFVFS